MVISGRLMDTEHGTVDDGLMDNSNGLVNGDLGQVDGY